MLYRAEIFDEFQFLYETTGFSDHQVHCVISFENRVDAAMINRAAQLLVKAVPILSRTYRNLGGKSCWEDSVSPNPNELFITTDNRAEFDRFTVSKTNEETGPQIRFCLLQSEADELSIVINHMVSDAAGFKQCVYLFSKIYSDLVKNKTSYPIT